MDWNTPSTSAVIQPPTLGERIFSNKVVVDKIIEHLGTKDRVSLSSVNCILFNVAFHCTLKIPSDKITIKLNNDIPELHIRKKRFRLPSKITAGNMHKISFDYICSSTGDIASLYHLSRRLGQSLRCLSFICTDKKNKIYLTRDQMEMLGKDMMYVDHLCLQGVILECEQGNSFQSRIPFFENQDVLELKDVTDLRGSMASLIPFLVGQRVTSLKIKCSIGRDNQRELLFFLQGLKYRSRSFDQLSLELYNEFFTRDLVETANGMCSSLNLKLICSSVPEIQFTGGFPVLDELKNINKLTSLELYVSCIHAFQSINKALQDLPDLPNLKRFIFEPFDAEYMDVSALRFLANITKMSISNCLHLTNFSVKHPISRLMEHRILMGQGIYPNVMSGELSIFTCKLLAALSVNTQVLRISGTPINDKRLLRIIKNLPNLAELYIENIPWISPETITKIVKTLALQLTTLVLYCQQPNENIEYFMQRQSLRIWGAQLTTVPSPEQKKIIQAQFDYVKTDCVKIDSHHDGCIRIYCSSE